MCGGPGGNPAPLSERALWSQLLGISSPQMGHETNPGFARLPSREALVRPKKNHGTASWKCSLIAFFSARFLPAC